MSLTVSMQKRIILDYRLPILCQGMEKQRPECRYTKEKNIFAKFQVKLKQKFLIGNEQTNCYLNAIS